MKVTITNYTHGITDVKEYTLASDDSYEQMEKELNFFRKVYPDYEVRINSGVNADFIQAGPLNQEKDEELMAQGKMLFPEYSDKWYPIRKQA